MDNMKELFFAIRPIHIYGLFTKAHFVIDSHTDALQSSFLGMVLPLHRFLSQRAITTIVTNEHLNR